MSLATAAPGVSDGPWPSASPCCATRVCPPRAMASPPVVELVNLQSGERLQVPADRIPAPSILNRFLRCAPERRYTFMDPRLVVAAIQAALAHGQRVSSGARSRVSARRCSTSRVRIEGRLVALRSRHLAGQALDLRIPGVSTEALCEHFKGIRLGGVGCYLGPRFVHVDVGPVRAWSG